MPITVRDLASTLAACTCIKKTLVCVCNCLATNKSSLLKMAIRNISAYLLILGTNEQLKKLATLRVFID